MRVEPDVREPEPDDDMRFGGADSWRWGFAIFPGAPGWTVVQSAPLEILLYGDGPRLSRLARELGVPAFQHSLYDGVAALLFETAASGRTSVTGFYPEQPERFRGGPPTADDAAPQFRLVDVRRAADGARRRGVAEVAGAAPTPPPDTDDELARHLERRSRAIRSWVEEHGGHAQERGSRLTWRASAADVVERMARSLAPLDVEAESEAVRAVFGGANARWADNQLSEAYLVPHHMLPVGPSVALYVDRAEVGESRRATRRGRS